MTSTPAKVALHAAEEKFLIEAGWTRTGFDCWLEPDLVVAEGERELHFGHAVNSELLHGRERGTHTMSQYRALMFEYAGYLLACGWTPADEEVHRNAWIPPASHGSRRRIFHGLRKAVSSQKFWAQSKERVFMDDRIKKLMHEHTKEEAIALAESKWWEGETDDEIVKRQLFTARLTMDLTKFLVALSNVLGRSVLTHELMDMDSLRKEYLGMKAAPTLDEVLGMLPAKTTVVVVEEEPVGEKS